MAFHEKSAWIMSLALLLGGIFYFGVVARISSEIGHLVPPMLPLVAVSTAILVAVAIAGHIVIALMAPKEAGNLLFYCVFGSLMFSQLVEYGRQIVLYRTTV